VAAWQQDGFASRLGTAGKIAVGQLVHDANARPTRHHAKPTLCRVGVAGRNTGGDQLTLSGFTFSFLFALYR
jgi:hypothetical protein